MNKEELLNKISEKLNADLPGALEKAEVLYDFPVFYIHKDKIHAVLSLLKNEPEFNFHFLTDLTGFQTADEKQLGVIYHLHNMPKNYRVRIKTFFDINKPEIPTATDLWPGANWMERETYDFFGVKFKGHPNLKRILNVDEMDIFPLRKEYPLEDQSREDKSDKMFGR
ncbi:MAG: NADH-quinone oxidoreductase subunit C [Bacteroidia bacterium]|nr:NADH-quinone oxidoreductase subunit C [Bacteroidia bacterium]MBN8691952.1 NADH-quinone oxidoreductase subunit C [Bacteroidota bacterium]